MRPWEPADRRVGVNAPSWLTFQVHRPYFDGGDSGLAAIQARGPLLAAELFERGRPFAPRSGMLMPESFRLLLTEESRLDAYRVRLPTDLPDRLASPAWRRMAAAFAARTDLGAAELAGLVQWLLAACLHRAVLEAAPPAEVGDDPAWAMLGYARATALFCTEGLSGATRAAFGPLVERPAATVGHLLAASAWGYLLARHGDDDRGGRTASAGAHRILDRLGGELSGFERSLHRARILARETLHPERHGDLQEAWALLGAAWEAHATAVPRDGAERAAHLETRRRLLDRQVELAARRGDEEAEEAAIRDGVALDPTCVKIRMQEAQLAERRGRIDEALAGYLLAARLGPFGTAFALLRAAGCARALGQRELARALTERAFRAAPRSARTRQALETAYAEAGDEPLVAVARACAPDGRRPSRRPGAPRGPARNGAERNGPAPHETSWHHRMYGAYFDLGTSRSPCLYARLPAMAFEFAEAGAYPRVDLQRVMPPAFRRNLVRESGLHAFAAERPADLPPALRTPAWERLCRWTAEFRRSDLDRQLLTANVLFRLGFHDLVLELVPEREAETLREPAEFYLHHLREMSRYTRSVGTARTAVPFRIFEMAGSPRCPLHLRLRGSVIAVVFEGRLSRSVEVAATWRGRAEEALAEVLAGDGEEFTPFEKAMLESRTYRGLSFVPFLRRDHAGVALDMDRSEAVARAVPAATDWERFLRDENLHACIESRSKESFAVRDLELGHRRTVEFLAIDPYDPKSHIEMGENLLRRGRPAEAADSYLRAAGLGPLGTAIGYHMAGECFERAGRRAEAEDCYAQALRLDPFAISAARGWARTAPESGMGGVASAYLAELEAWGTERRSVRVGDARATPTLPPSPGVPQEAGGPGSLVEPVAV